MTDTIGIDISKDHLDAHRLSDEKCAQFANTKAGLKTLNKWIGCTSHRVVYEATGRYHREMEACLSQAGFALVKVNPRRARQFANAIGKDAKTDRIDAAMLARMGSVLELKGQPLKTENMHDLSELYVARRCLIKDQTACRNRLAGVRHKLVKSQLKARLGHVEKQITQVDAELKRLIHKDESLKRSFTILTSIPGIGAVAATSVLIEMPEIGTMTSSQVGALAGLAPVTRESGNWKGQSHIKGGRAGLRKALYMPALVAVRFNRQMCEKYTALRAAGKPAKLALTVIMRKLIILANSLIHENREWTEIRP